MVFLNRKNRKKVFISLFPKRKGGGANSFSFNISRWIRENSDKYVLVTNILKSDFAVIIAHKAEYDEVSAAKSKGTFIIHRLDEYFSEAEEEFRKEKHRYIIKLNKLSDVTVYQSNFVFNNVQPYLNAGNYKIILNGADNRRFYPGPSFGEYIGHVSWSYDHRKGFNRLHDIINRYPSEKFLLVGNHHKTGIDFRHKNVKFIKAVTRSKMPLLYREMKALFLPSENDPCPNTAVESVLSGVPVCYNPVGGTQEIVQDCGCSIDRFDVFLNNLCEYRKNCFKRDDLHFDKVAEKYMDIYGHYDE